MIEDDVAENVWAKNIGQHHNEAADCRPTQHEIPFMVAHLKVLFDDDLLVVLKCFSAETELAKCG